MESKGVKPEDVTKFASAAGLELPEQAVQNFLSGNGGPGGRCGEWRNKRAKVVSKSDELI